MERLNITQILDKTTHYDKDERYMATSDLCNELQKDIKIDATLEKRICAAILKQLDDTSNDVQSIAVKCLGILVTKVQQAQVSDICDKLCSLLLDGKQELRDIYSIGLKTLISDVPETMGSAIAPRLVHRLLGGISQDKVHEIKLESLDNMTDLIKRFGSEVHGDHENIMETILTQLDNEKPVVRKRATAALGSLAVVLSEPLLNRLTENLLSQIEHPRKNQDVRTLIQTIGTISRTVGYRLGRHLDRIIPIFLRFIGDPEDESLHNDAANDLRENCFQGFESFVLRCHREVTSHLDEILKVALEFVKFDPNYSYGDSDEDEEMENEEEEFSDDEADDYSDDDDTSWKVRRAALRVINAVIVSRPELLDKLYESCGVLLVNRFKEREESVRIDIINAFAEMLRVTIALESKQESPTSGVSVARSSYAAPRLNRQSSGAVSVKLKVPSIIKSALKQLGPKGSVKVKSATLNMLRQLAIVSSDSLPEHLPLLVPAILRALHDRNSSLKLDALHFLKVVIVNSPPKAIQPYVKDIAPPVVHCVAEEWYKIIAEGLRVISNLVTVIRPRQPKTGDFDNSFDLNTYHTMFYEAVMPRLEANDIDQEIKECAITAMGTILSFLGDKLVANLPRVLPLLLDRLKNEITRMPTMKALSQISSSKLKLDLSLILGGAVETLALFLRQQSRTLKQVTLDTLDAIVSTNGINMSEKLFSDVISETALLINDSDLHLSHLALKLTTSILAVSPASKVPVKEKILPKALELAKSPLLQGAALTSLLNLYKNLVNLNVPGASFDDLLGALLQDGDLPKQAVANVARCVAVLCLNTQKEKCQQTVSRFVDQLKRPSDDHMSHLYLMCLGEIGKKMDLSNQPDLQKVVLGAFESGSEETKSAAAFALGSISVGNMTKYLPILFDALATGKTEYLLLSALREVISCHTAEDAIPAFLPHVDQVYKILRDHCENEEEGVRNMVAECLGKLSTIDPDRIIPLLAGLCSADSPLLCRWTAVTALKYCVGSTRTIKQLQPNMLVFLRLLKDEDLRVRRAALLMLNSTAHHQPRLIQDHLAKNGPIFSVLLETVGLKLERTVDLGPFKHKVDDGLPLRKASFACVDTILDSLTERIDISSLIEYLKKGLVDNDDVQMLSHQILSKICNIQPGVILSALDCLIDPLDKTINRKVKDTQVGTEVERANDLIRSALRAIDTLNQVPDLAMDRKWQDFMDRLHKKEKLVEILNSIRAERGETREH